LDKIILLEVFPQLLKEGLLPEARIEELKNIINDN
jgi:hypothetical protein